MGAILNRASLAARALQQVAAEYAHVVQEGFLEVHL